MGFRLKRKVELADINSVGYEYDHENGAKLIFIQNEDVNKVFSVTFKTPADNDKGVPHIVEHSLFCGSEKYCVKDPFNEMAKGSLYTFLNAMTYRDKTVYPIASCNKQDFYNLMEVYLDAVYFPMIKKNKASFLQEGINCEFGDNGEIKNFGGIVYNEMKGVYSDSREYLEMGIYKSLFPNTQYQYDAGGVPECIETLTYEEFLAFYDSHYRASNSYMYLYGDLDIDEALEFIDEKYMSRLVKKPNVSNIEYQRDQVGISKFSSVYAPDGSRGYCGVSYVINGLHSNEEVYAFALLCQFVFLEQSSIIKRKLYELGIAQDIEISVNFDVCQPVLSIILRNTDASPEYLKEVIDAELRIALKEGLDEDLITACINRKEFLLCEGNYGRRPRGLGYNIEMLQSWIYGKDPFEVLSWKKELAQLRNDFSVFKSLLSQLLLENKFFVLSELKPDEHFKVASQLGNVDVPKARSDSEILKKFSSTPDSVEALSELPLLALEDIDNKPENIPLEVKYSDKILYTLDETNGIAYAQLMFHMDKVPAELLPYVSLIDYFIKKLPTQNYSVNKLTSSVVRDLGGLSSNIAVRKNIKTGEAIPMFALTVKALKENATKIFEYAEEILIRTVYDNDTEILRLLNEYSLRLEKSFSFEGQNLAIMQSKAYISEVDRYKNLLMGYDFYCFLKEVQLDFKTKSKEFCENIDKAIQFVFTSENFSAGICCEEEEYSRLENLVLAFDKKLHQTKQLKSQLELKTPVQNTAFIAKTRVQFVAKSMGYDKDLKPCGSLFLLSSLLSKDFLMKEIRILGGAYGTGASLSRTGILTFYSYRDPNLENTLNAYARSLEYYESNAIDERELKKMIIGEVSKYIKPQTPQQKCLYAIELYLSGLNYEEILREFNEVLNAKPADIVQAAKRLKEVNSVVSTCAVGEKTKILQLSDFFDEIIEF